MTPAPLYQPIEWKKGMGNSRRQKGNKQIRPIKKALALLSKRSSTTQSNTGSARSFHRHTEKGIKFLWYCEVLQRRGASVYSWTTEAPRVIRIGTVTPYLYSIHVTATVQRCEYYTQPNPQLKTGTTDHFSSSLSVYRQLNPTLQSSTPKQSGQNPESISQRELNTREASEKLL